MESRGQGLLCAGGQATRYSRPDLAHTMFLALLQGAVSRAGAALTLHEAHTLVRGLGRPGESSVGIVRLVQALMGSSGNSSVNRQQPDSFAFAPPAHDPPPPPPLSAASDAADWPLPPQLPRQEYDERMYLPSASEGGAARWGALPPSGQEALGQRLAWSEPSEQQQQQQPQFGQFDAGRQPSYLSHSLHDWAQEQQAAPAPPPPRMAAAVPAIQPNAPSSRAGAGPLVGAHQPYAPSSHAGAGPLAGAHQPDYAASRSSGSSTSAGRVAGPFAGAHKLVSLWQTTNQALGGVHH